MALTKDQIISIDAYLKTKGLKYWDIRLEMVDHLASKLETNKDLVLNDALLNKEFGDFFQVKKTAQLITLNIKRKYRKLLFNEAKSFLSSFKNILLLALVFVLEIVLFLNNPNKIFLKVNLLLLLIPSNIPAYFAILNSIRKNNSRNIEMALHYATYSLLILGFINVVNFIDPSNTHIVFKQLFLSVILIVLVPIHYLLVYCGMKNYHKIYKEYTNLFKEQRKINAA